MIQKTWKVDALDCAVQLDGLPNVVRTVHWRLNAQEDTHYASVYGSAGLTVSEDIENTFIAYEDLDEATVIAWVKESLGEESVAQYEASVEAQIELLKNPVEVKPPLPWVLAQLPEIE